MRRFSVFTQRSLGEAERVELAPAAELSAEHRGEVDPDSFLAALDLIPAEALVVIAAAEEIPGALHDFWEDVTAAADEEQRASLLRGRRRAPPAPRSPLARGGRRPGALLQGAAGRVPVADPRRGGGRAREAEPLGLPDRGRLRGPRRGGAHPLQPEPPRRAVPRRPATRGARCELRGGEAARGLPLAGVATRGDPAAPPGSPPPSGRAGLRPSPPRRSDRAAGRRLRRPRGPRHRPLLRLRHQDPRRGDTRLPGARVPRRRPRLRPDRPAGPDQPLHGRRRGRARAQPPRREALAEHEVPGAPLRPGDGRRPDQPLRRAPGAQGPRLLARRRDADGLRGGLPLSRDRRSDGRDRRGQGRHGVGAADGPPDLRRRRLRQDRDRAARRPQGGGGRQAGDDARADDDPRPAALRHLPRALRGHAVQRRDGLPAAQAGRGQAESSSTSARGGWTS